MDYQHLIVKAEGPVGHLVLNRPERRNALSLELMREAVRALEGFGADPEVRVVVLSGAGPAFSAGHDLSELTGHDLAFYQEVFDVCTAMMGTIHRIPQPVIARVHGVATAAGCQLVATCDLAVASTEARFATPGVRIGLFCSTPMVPLSRAVGRKRAMQMLLTGEPIDAPTALAWGLVNEVVPPEALDAAVDRWVAAVLRASPLTVGIGKQAFWAQVDLDEARAYEHTKAVMTMNLLAHDAQEGICAFLEKREPRWEGR